MLVRKECLALENLHRKIDELSAHEIAPWLGGVLVGMIENCAKVDASALPSEAEVTDRDWNLVELSGDVLLTTCKGGRLPNCEPPVEVPVADLLNHDLGRLGGISRMVC